MKREPLSLCYILDTRQSIWNCKRRRCKTGHHCIQDRSHAADIAKEFLEPEPWMTRWQMLNRNWISGCTPAPRNPETARAIRDSRPKMTNSDTCSMCGNSAVLAKQRTAGEYIDIL